MASHSRKMKRRLPNRPLVCGAARRARQLDGKAPRRSSWSAGRKTFFGLYAGITAGHLRV